MSHRTLHSGHHWLVRRLLAFVAAVFIVSSFSSKSDADLLVDFSTIPSVTFAINPQNAMGVRYEHQDIGYWISGVQIFVGTSEATPITADFSIIQFSSMDDPNGTVIETISNVAVSSQFPDDFATESVFVDLSAINLKIKNGGIYGFVLHNPSSGFLIGRVAGATDEATVAGIVSGTTSGGMGDSTSPDMAFQAFGTAIPEPSGFVAMALFATSGLGLRIRRRRRRTRRRWRS